MSALVCLFHTHLYGTTNAVRNVIVRLRADHDDNPIASNLVPFIDDSFECQFTLLNLSSEFGSEDLECDQAAFALATKVFKEFRPFVSLNLFRFNKFNSPSLDPLGNV
jgi:hypothetical protein